MKILFAVTACLSALSGILVTYQLQSAPQDQSVVAPTDPESASVVKLLSAQAPSGPPSHQTVPNDNFVETAEKQLADAKSAAIFYNVKFQDIDTFIARVGRKFDIPEGKTANEAGTISIISDPRLNRLWVSGTTKMLDEFIEFARKVDSDPHKVQEELNAERPFLKTYPITIDPKLAYDLLSTMLEGRDVRMQQDEISGAITVLGRKDDHARVVEVLASVSDVKTKNFAIDGTSNTITDPTYGRPQGAGDMLPSGPTIGNMDPLVYRLIVEYAAADEDKREKIKDQLKDSLSNSYKQRMKYHQQKLSSLKKRVEELEKQLSKRRSNSQEIVDLQLKLIIKQAEMGELLGVNINEPSSGFQRPNADLVEREQAAIRYAVKTQLLQRSVNELTTKINKSRKHLAELTSDLARCEEVLKNGTDACIQHIHICLLYTSPSPRDATLSRMPSSA